MPSGYIETKHNNYGPKKYRTQKIQISKKAFSKIATQLLIFGVSTKKRKTTNNKNHHNLITNRKGKCWADSLAKLENYPWTWVRISKPIMSSWSSNKLVSCSAAHYWLQLYTVIHSFLWRAFTFIFFQAVLTDNGSCSLRSHTVGWSLRGDWQRILFHCGHTRSAGRHVVTDNGSCSLRSHTVGDCYVLGWAPAPRFLPSVDCIKVQCRLYQSTVWTVPKYCVDWSLRGDCNKVCGMRPKCPVYLCLQNEHTRTLKSLQYMSVFGGLWKQNNNNKINTHLVKMSEFLKCWSWTLQKRR